jgi:hypothetical protein
MEIYNTIAGWSGWPPIVAILLLAGAFAYWVMRKQAHILKENNHLLREKLATFKDSTPDMLVDQLGSRLRVMDEELKRLLSDRTADQKLIREKEAELMSLSAQVINLMDQLKEDGLVCPQCGAPLQTRECPSEVMEYQGTEIEVDHEIARYECGLELSDGSITSRCQKNKNEC